MGEGDRFGGGGVGFGFSRPGLSFHKRQFFFQEQRRSCYQSHILFQRISGRLCIAYVSRVFHAGEQERGFRRYCTFWGIICNRQIEPSYKKISFDESLYFFYSLFKGLHFKSLSARPDVPPSYVKPGSTLQFAKCFERPMALLPPENFHTSPKCSFTLLLFFSFSIPLT